MKKTTKNILNTINSYGKLIREAYFPENFDESEPMDRFEEEPEDDEDESSVIELDDNEVVNQLRKLALKGIQKYSEDISNPLYEFYKKIWAECDKLITDAAKKHEIGGNKE